MDHELASTTLAQSFEKREPKPKSEKTVIIKVDRSKMLLFIYCNSRTVKALQFYRPSR